MEKEKMMASTSLADTGTPASDPVLLAFDQLVLVSLTNRDVGSWLAEAHNSGKPWSKVPIKSLSEAEGLLDASDGKYLVVCYDCPTDRIAHHLNDGLAPSQALVEWEAEIESLLSLYRKNYERMALVSQDVLLGRYDEVERALASRSGIKIGCVKTISERDAGRVEPSSAISAQHQLVALHALSHQPARTLFHELEASSLLAPDPGKGLDVLDSLYMEIGKNLSIERELMRGEQHALAAVQDQLRRDIKTLTKNKQNLSDENELLVKQLHTTQEKLESALIAQKDAESKVRLQDNSIKQKNLKLQKLSAAYHGAKRSKDELSADRQRLQTELDLVYVSRSWRITGPLRKSMTLLRRSGGGRQE